MLLSIIIFICLLFYTVIVAQSISYIVSLTDVQQKMNVEEYISFRKITDKNFRAKFAYAFYGALLSNFSLLLITLIYFDLKLVMVFTISFISLVIDTIITVKGNMPINNDINTWTNENHPGDWKEYRKNWLRYFRYRQIANLSGYICLIIGIVFLR